MIRANRGVVFGFAILATVLVIGCGGGEEATPAPLPTATARPALTATAAATPGATATVPTGVTASPTPAPTPTPRLAPTPTPRSQEATGKLTVALVNLGTEDLDPITSSNSTMGIIGGPMYDWAIWHQKDGSLTPGVFERFEQASDGMSWSFNVRDMKFHDGNPVTAEDVKFALERTLLPEATGSGGPAFKASIASVEVTSAKSGVIRLKQPWPVMPFSLSPADASQGIIFSRAAFQAAGGTKAFFYGDKAIGTGPFRLVGHQTSVRYVFEATGQKHSYREQPAFKTIELLAVPEASTRVAMIRTGAADIASITPESVGSLRQGGFPILQLPEVTFAILRLWGMDNPDLKGLPTADAKVREALHLAINRQEIVSILLGGLATVPVREFMWEGSEGFDPSWKPAPYDPGRAKALLAEAGFSAGLKITLYNQALPQAPWTPRAGEAIAGYWSAIGVNAELVPIEYGSWRPLQLERPHKKALGAYGWVVSLKTAQPTRPIDSHYSSKGALHTLAIPELDAAYSRATQTLDATERVRLIRQIVDMVFNTWFTIPVANTSDLYAASQAIAGWDPVRTGGAGLSWETVRRK